jgi:hypothetical protein
MGAVEHETWGRSLSIAFLSICLCLCLGPPRAQQVVCSTDHSHPRKHDNKVKISDRASMRVIVDDQKTPHNIWICVTEHISDSCLSQVKGITFLILGIGIESLTLSHPPAKCPHVSIICYCLWTGTYFWLWSKRRKECFICWACCTRGNNTNP